MSTVTINKSKKTKMKKTPSPKKEQLHVLTFVHKGKPQLFSDKYITHLYKNQIDWLYMNGYRFNDPKLHKGVYMKIYTQKDILTMTNFVEMHRLPNGTYFAIDRDVKLCSDRITKMLTSFGCTSIKIYPVK